MEGGPRRLGPGGGGGCNRAASARRTGTWESALSMFKRLRAHGHLHSWQSFVLLGWEESSSGTHHCHLHQLVAIERRFPHDAAGRVLEHMVLESFRLCKSERTIKGIISPATMAADVRLADVDILATTMRRAWQQRSLTALMRECMQWLARYLTEPVAKGERPWTNQQPEKGVRRLLHGSPFEVAPRHAWNRAGA